MTGEREGLAEIAGVLRKAAREHIGLTEGEFWPSTIADAQADALADLLAARERRVRGEALREAADVIVLPGSDTSGFYAGEVDAGYREAEQHAEDWLRDRADRIEAP